MTASRFRAGTSGFAYDEWAGVFYPPELPARERLAYYASRLPAVEINNTFYRMPKPQLLEGWATQVPAGFRFAIKAPQRITHHKRLKDAGEETRYLLSALAALGERLGCVLFQLPPHLKADPARLASFLELLPAGFPAAFEFRHPSWFDPGVLTQLAERRFSLCFADTGGEGDPPLEATADWGYVRLRRESYAEIDLAAWHDRLARLPWGEAFVFFKHEDAGTGPRLAARFLELAAAADRAGAPS